MTQEQSGSEGGERERPAMLEYAHSQTPGNPLAAASAIAGWVSLGSIVMFIFSASSGFPVFALLAMWLISAIPAILFGHGGLRRARALGGAGRGLARQGLVLGWSNLILALLVAIVLPTLGRAHPRANRVKCASNLRQIWQGITVYAEDHGGQFPARLDQLIAGTYTGPEPFVCPQTKDAMAEGPTTQAVVADFGKPGRCSYIYLGAGYTSSALADVVVVYEKIENHDGDGANMLFADGHVDWCYKPLALKVIAELKAGKNPPPSLVAPQTQPQGAGARGQ